LSFLLACALLLICGAPGARAQAPDDRSVLLLLDASKSMNEDAGNGRTRLDAAKSAVTDLVGLLPADAQVGMRVYGARVAEASRRAGCRDTQLVVPVGPLDREQLRSRVQALQGRGRTPIGRSLRAAAEDLPSSGKRTVILVSDGGDNCAPPDPCKAAEAVAKAGVNLNISVVGLQVNERVRRQLRCIARAGGGTYVDAGDADALRREILAAIARAFRDYKPVGTPVTGGPSREQATAVAAGQYLDSIRAGEERWYAVNVKRGQRLFAAATTIPPRDLGGTGSLRLKLFDPSGRSMADETTQVGGGGGQNGGIDTLATRAKPATADGVYQVGVVLEPGSLSQTDIPLELAIQPLDEGERPAFVRPPGALPAALGAGRVSTPTPTPSKTPEPTPEAEAKDASPSAPALAGVAAAGLVVGLIGGLRLLRRRGS
jgi:Ca-activated chloride channel family protein